MHDFRWPELITLGVLVLLFMLAWNVGRARAKYKIKTPATTAPASNGFTRPHHPAGK